MRRFGGVLAVLVLGAAAAGAQPAAPTAEQVNRGAKAFEQYGCVACHGQKAAGGSIGPPLKHLFGRPVTLRDGTSVTADSAYLRESITQPNAKVVKGYAPVMPQLAIPPDDVAALVAYIQSLR